MNIYYLRPLNNKYYLKTIMYFILINILSWVISGICFYLILNPNIRLFKKIHKSPYKKIVKKDLENSFNVIDVLKKKEQNEIIHKYKSFKNKFNVIIFNFNGGLNIGTIMRTACVYGCDKYFIIGRKIYDSRSCVGSNKYVDLQINKDIIKSLPDKNDKPIVNKEKFKKFLIKNKISPVFVEQGGTNINKFSFNNYLVKANSYTPTFIFGNETFGIDLDLMKYCSDLPGYTILTIPQPGLLKSLNVSNSASIVLWEYYRQVLHKENIQYKYDLN